MDLTSIRSICLHSCTILDNAGDSGGLLLNIGLILKWFSLLLSHFWRKYRIGVESLNSRLYLLCTSTFTGMIKE